MLLKRKNTARSLSLHVAPFTDRIGVFLPYTPLHRRPSYQRHLANTDFKDVKMCEGVDCVLWFLDKTKARKRLLVQYGCLWKPP